MKAIKKILKIVRIALGIGLLFMWFSGMFVWFQRSIIIEVNSIQETLTEQRETAFEVELTAITDTVMEVNKRLDLWQYISKKVPVLFTEEFKNLERVK